MADNKRTKNVRQPKDRRKARWCIPGMAKRFAYWVSNNRAVRVSMVVGIGECLIAFDIVDREVVTTWLSWLV